jgi:hypothetical protein
MVYRCNEKADDRRAGIQWSDSGVLYPVFYDGWYIEGSTYEV